MATRFELVMYGEDAVALRGAGEEALAEVRRLEGLLSFYDASSEISRVNRGASTGSVRVAPEVFALIKEAKRLHALTQGAFDITVGPLMQCWGFVRGRGAWPSEDQRQFALERTGMQHVRLRTRDCSVRFDRPDMLLDLGAIGKGYAVEEACAILADCGVTRALLHGGTSTVATLGAPPDQADGWTVGIAPLDQSDQPIRTVCLRDLAMSVSAIAGKAFVHEGEAWGHVIDPRSGYPVRGAVQAVAIHESATTCDAIATACLVLGRAESEHMTPKFDSIRLMCAYRTAESVELETLGDTS